MAGIYNETGRHGNYDQIAPRWKGAVAVACGDILYRDASNYDQPAGNYTWDTDLATTQASFHDVFRGISMARRLTTQAADGDRQDGMILASGEFMFPCAALGSDAEVGSYVACAKATGNALESQKVAITATLGNAIGVLTERAVTGQTYLVFKIVPVLTEKRGVQAVQ